MLALPFALLTNALTGKSLGSYMGLFNCTICLPQIVASLVGGVLFMTFGGKVVEEDVPVVEEAKVEVVAENVATEEAVEEIEVSGATATEVEVSGATATEVQMSGATVIEESEATEAVVEQIKTEKKKFQSGQYMMLVIAGVSLILGALAVFGINTRRKE
jgi:hypothetical protein